MTIEIWSDVMCPFCYIGKRHLEKALDQFGNKESIDIIWKSFQLNPNMPESTDENVYEYLAKAKGISYDESIQMHEQVEQMAAKAGLNYQFEKASVSNSFKAHRVLHMAKRRHLGDKLKEELLHAYFMEGINMSNEDALVKLGERVGLDRSEVELALNDETFSDYVKADIQEAADIGVRGVPFFVFNRKYAISGAQPVENFIATLEKVQKESKLM